MREIDHPTWGGLIGFMLSKQGVEEAFGRTFSGQFNIHRTRQNFPNNGIDSFGDMADKGLAVTERVIVEQMGGSVDSLNNLWIIPLVQ